MNKLVNFLKKDIVLCISGLAAFLSVFLTPISADYLGYIDFKVLALLFSLMAIVEGVKAEGSFEVLSHAFLSKVGSIRTASFVLVSLCFFIAMAVTNDVALITMVPFTMAVMDFVSEKRIIFLIVMETVAANLGSMLTPIGNPQNLYLFSYYDIRLSEFLKITFPISAISFVIITIVILAAKSRKINVVFDVKVSIQDKKKFASFIFSFFACLLTVAGIVPYQISLLITVVITAICNRKIFKNVDYALLLTFVFFFIFVGNISRTDEIATLLASLIESREMFASLFASQIISNVPAAVLLSAFTENYEALILGTNIGGLGTLIASLASLISWKFYIKRIGARPKLYFLCFTAINIIFLLILCLSCAILDLI